VDLSAFDYELPPELIAQAPAASRDASRLLVIDRARQTFQDDRFADLPGLLRPGDCLVVNDSRVIPARVLARDRGGRAVELLFVAPASERRWLALVRPGRRCRVGAELFVGAEPPARLAVVGQAPDGPRLVERLDGTLEDLMAAHGRPPLPPYIARFAAPTAEDRERYQTVYARPPGSIAAPTAGLHFTPELLAGLNVERVTLHVGLDTFRPLSTETLEEHELHGERYRVAPDAWERIRGAERVLAVGTTTVRVLETLARGGPLAGRTDLFVTPGFEFRRVDALLTNFHLPRSTLLALVMAFAGIEETRRLYELAIAERYRFYSFGDAMLIL